MDNFMPSFIIFLVLILVSRVINEKANKKLTQEKKAELIDLFSKNRITTYAFIIVIFAAYYLILEYDLFDLYISLAIYVLLLVSLLIFNARSAMVKLKTNDFPKSYIKSYVLASMIRFIAIFVFLGLLFM